MLLFHRGLTLFGQCSATDTEDGPLIGLLAFGIESDELHAIGVEREEHFGLPHDGRALLTQHIEDGLVGHVSLAGSGQATIECYLEAVGPGITVEKLGSGIAWTHRVAARRAVSYAVELFQCFHKRLLCGLFLFYSCKDSVFCGIDLSLQQIKCKTALSWRDYCVYSWRWYALLPSRLRCRAIASLRSLASRLARLSCPCR